MIFIVVLICDIFAGYLLAVTVTFTFKNLNHRNKYGFCDMPFFHTVVVFPNGSHAIGQYHLVAWKHYYFGWILTDSNTMSRLPSGALQDSSTSGISRHAFLRLWLWVNILVICGLLWTWLHKTASIQYCLPVGDEIRSGNCKFPGGTVNLKRPCSLQCSCMRTNEGRYQIGNCYNTCRMPPVGQRCYVNGTTADGCCPNYVDCSTYCTFVTLEIKTPCL